jgi:hypothetical protein
MSLIAAAIRERSVKHWCRPAQVYDLKMRAIACAIALLLLNPSILAQSDAAAKEPQDNELQSGYCPRTHDLEAEPQEEHWLEGAIRNNKVRMYLDRGGGGVVGLFYAPGGDWTPTFLGGEWGAKGIALLAEAADHAPKGHLQGHLVKGAFIGSWTPESSGHADPVRLAAIKQPACDGRGAWKRFDDPKWPVSFSYPASWHIKEDDDALRLICPDPEAMAYNGVVTIWEDKGKPGGPWDLVQCANGWQFGPKCDDKESDLFRVTNASQQQGKTILSLDHEWRVYCSDGGYVAQGDGEDQVVVLDGYWAEFMGAGAAYEIVDRLVKSASPRAAHNAK